MILVSEKMFKLTDILIVVDDKNDIAYISDSGVPLNPSDPMKPGLIVYKLKSNTATRFLDSHESVMPVWYNMGLFTLH
jgi:hypothetical protein